VDCHTELFRKHEDVMLIGFARRFATYKRADLVFEDLERLKRILGNPDRPVVLLFAGKAHPNDEPGKQLLHKIHSISLQPEFTGKVILLEGYDMALARQLISGVDIWLNTPEYPMEACGTSGMKAGINGVINFSVLDGWWAEGFNGNNGWGIHPHIPVQSNQQRRHLEAGDLLDLLEHEIIPMYFDKVDGYSQRWVQASKESMKSIIPMFNSHRMLMDYINKLYLPALAISEKLQADLGARASELAEWKHKINRCWSGVRFKRLDEQPAGIKQGNPLKIRVAVTLNGLDPDDIIVECLIGRSGEEGTFTGVSCYALEVVEKLNDNEVIYGVQFVPEMSGLISYEIRAYPFHTLLTHPLVLGHMKWV
jgi:starch phosphorylase